MQKTCFFIYFLTVFIKKIEKSRNYFLIVWHMVQFFPSQNCIFKIKTAHLSNSSAAKPIFGIFFYSISLKNFRTRSFSYKNGFSSCYASKNKITNATTSLYSYTALISASSPTLQIQCLIQDNIWSLYGSTTPFMIINNDHSPYNCGFLCFWGIEPSWLLS